MDINHQITLLKQQIRQNEIANDSYYLSRQSQQDYRLLHKLESLLKQQQLTKKGG